jgi:hypothetical protein
MGITKKKDIGWNKQGKLWHTRKPKLDMNDVWKRRDSFVGELKQTNLRIIDQ